MKRICLDSLVLLCVLAAIGAGAGAQSRSTHELSGTVRDTAGVPVAEATVSLLNARQSVIDAALTDNQGRFSLHGIAPGSYELLVTSRHGFAPRRLVVQIPFGETSGLDVKLGVEVLSEVVTVTADIGLVQATDETTQQVNVINERKLFARATTVLAQAAQEETGLQLQRTSPTIGAIFVRGLTGAKVTVFVDGVRFSTAAMRGGINTFFNLNEVSNLRDIEVLRGPNSAQFGSDSIGGGIHLISHVPLYTSKQFEFHGQVNTGFNSADLSYGGNTLMTFGGKNLAVLINLASRRANTIRPGGGLDTHAAVTRFLGLPSNVFGIFGERMTDTAFTQYSGLFRISTKLTPIDQLSVHYQRSHQDGGKRYDQTLGGDGNLIADLRNLMLDFTYWRYERFRAGWFDTFAVSYSFNSQREERVNQGGNGNPAGGITHQYERTMVNGAQAQATKLWGASNSLAIGGEFYYDYVRSPAFTVNPVSSAVSLTRPRVPDRATYRSGGVYAQGVVEAVPTRLRLTGAVRFGAATYRSRAANSPIAGGVALWPDDSLSAHSVTPRFGAVFTVLPGLNLSAQVSGGFRAPHITDLGTVGLTGNGFEASAADLAGQGATIGSTADRTAASTGLAVRQLVPEASWTYEGGVHLYRGTVGLDVIGFVNDIYDNIAVQSLILPPGAVGLQLGDQRITSQDPNGVVFVPASTNPVLVRANYGNARIHGIEQKLDWRIMPSWVFGNTFTWLHAEDRRTGRPPNIEGGTPALQGWARLRYQRSGSRFWIEPYVYAADRQDRLSSLDLEDRRTGALRSRTSIRSFFLNGATVRGLVAAGPDARLGTADDVLIATNETVTQVQDRVLGVGVASRPLWTYIPGFLTVNLRGGVNFAERHEVTIDLENLADRNYRGISWGLDAPGRSIGFRYSYQF